MTYQIIKDEPTLLNFINWLPDLEPNEQFYLCLFARKKYDPTAVHSSDKTQLRRFTATKQTILSKIRQLECQVGAYELKGNVVSQESLVLYINPNPRDFIRATFDSIRNLTTCIQNKAQGFNPHQEVMSCIQRAVSRKIWFDVDIDENDLIELEKTIELVKQYLNQECLSFLKTRGGIHCLIELKRILPEFNKSWYKNIMSIPNVDKTSDQLLPVAGCVQGGFMPHFITF